MHDVIVVGGGIVGLATAYKMLCASPHTRLLLLEKEDRLGSHQTGRNSGVIHAGIYYRPGSLKARLSVEGVRKLLSFCEEQEVPYELCGKIIVATSEEEVPRLHALLERGRANSVPGLRLIAGHEIAAFEPHAQGVAAIHSPRTGIISFSSVAEALAERIRAMGATISTQSKAMRIENHPDGAVVESTSGDHQGKLIINSAGLFTDRLAAGHGGVQVIPFRGEYYRLKDASRHLVRNLIYPVPNPLFPFLGVHFTRVIDGHVEAGPNAVLAFSREGYRKTDVNLRDCWEMFTYSGFWRMSSRFWRTGLGEYYRSFVKGAFVTALQKLVPEIQSVDLEKAPAGVRAMAVEPDGALIDDFRVVRDGCIVHVLNAPSPAATTCLAIGEHVVSEVTR